MPVKNENPAVPISAQAPTNNATHSMWTHGPPRGSSRAKTGGPKMSEKLVEDASEGHRPRVGKRGIGVKEGGNVESESVVQSRLRDTVSSQTDTLSGKLVMQDMTGDVEIRELELSPVVLKTEIGHAKHVNTLKTVPTQKPKRVVVFPAEIVVLPALSAGVILYVLGVIEILFV